MISAARRTWIPPTVFNRARGWTPTATIPWSGCGSAPRSSGQQCRVASPGWSVAYWAGRLMIAAHGRGQRRKAQGLHLLLAPGFSPTSPTNWSSGLEDRGFAPFLDRHDIAAGEDWEARLGGLIAQADTVVFVVSPEAVKSERCVLGGRQDARAVEAPAAGDLQAGAGRRHPRKLAPLQFVRFDTAPGHHAAAARTGRRAADRSRLDPRAHAARRACGALAGARASRSRCCCAATISMPPRRGRRRARLARPRSPTRSARSSLRARRRESARLGKERAQLEQMRRAQAATARQQKRAGAAAVGHRRRWCWQ